MITKNNCINAGIIIAWLVNVLTLNFYIIETVDIAYRRNTSPMNLPAYKTTLIICSIILVSLYVIKLVLFFIDKKAKKEQ